MKAMDRITHLHKPFYHIIESLFNSGSISPEPFKSLTPEDWKGLYELSITQGLTAIAYIQLKPIFERVDIPSDLKRMWRIHSLTINKKMEEMNKTCAEFAEKMEEKGIPVVALKGIAYSSYYPDPNIRECGDLDCYMLGKKEEGDRVILELGGTMEEAGVKHSHLFFKGITIENHQYFTNFDNTKQGRFTEKVLERLMSRGYEYLPGTKLLNPNPDFTAVFLIKHAHRHFLYEGIRLRHLLDWAFFLKEEQKRIDWDTVFSVLERCKLLSFARLMTNVCAKEFGLKVWEDALKELPDKVGSLRNCFLNDIMGDHPEIQDKNLFRKGLRILRRFYRMWKYRAIADESYLRMVWNVFAFNSFTKNKLEL